MTVAELIEELKYMEQDAEVRFAQQPSCPFEYDIVGVVEVKVDEDDVVYLEEGRQLGYLPGEAKDELGW